MALNKSTISRQQCQVCFAEGPTIIDPSSTRGTNTTTNTSGGANEPYQPQVPRQAATRGGPRGNFHTIYSWPDDEEEQRQQHSDGHAADVDAVLPVAPQVAAADCVGKKKNGLSDRVVDETNDRTIRRSLTLAVLRLSLMPEGKRSDAARAPSASGSNSIFGAS